MRMLAPIGGTKPKLVLQALGKREAPARKFDLGLNDIGIAGFAGSLGEAMH
jgi:hypothetical protein